MEMSVIVQRNMDEFLKPLPKDTVSYSGGNWLLASKRLKRRGLKS
jgi:hypothetical protein